jgi:hypothetical protein
VKVNILRKLIYQNLVYGRIFKFNNNNILNNILVIIQCRLNFTISNLTKEAIDIFQLVLFRLQLDE